MSESKSMHQYRMSMKLKAVAIAIGVLGAAFFFAVLSSVLSELVRRASEVQAENDLTI